MRQSSPYLVSAALAKQEIEAKRHASIVARRCYSIRFKPREIAAQSTSEHESWKRRSRCFTIGHSTRTLDEARRDGFGPSIVTVLVDIRMIPRSRHNPHSQLLQKRSPTHPERIPARGLHRYVHLRGSAACASRVPIRRIKAGATRASSGYADYIGDR